MATYYSVKSMMQNYKDIFIESAYKCGALQFGEFTLNSGRKSPFFFNTGKFSNGSAINAIANAYVDTIINNGLKFDMIFGPAYKGIPLVTSISQVLYQRENLSVPFSFNRKEKKDHGETGLLVGAEIKKKVLVIDDVISSGVSIAESIQIIRKNKGEVACILIALDRKEKKDDSLNNEEALSIMVNIPIFSIINYFDIINFIQDKPDLSTYRDSLVRYHNKYGIN